MRRWDGLLDGYIKECEARGLAAVTVEQRQRELEKAGAWLKRRRPKVDLGEVGSELLIRYLRTRGRFRLRATIAGAVSIPRGMGEYLAKDGIWLKNPLRWIKGPKLDPRMSLPRRVGKAEMKRLWEEVEKKKPESLRAVVLCVLVVLYGTGLRRGEPERLDIGDWDREGRLLRVDGRTASSGSGSGRRQICHGWAAQKRLLRPGLRQWGESYRVFRRRYGLSGIEPLRSCE